MRAKQMITVDQNRVYRIHKVKAIKLMADKDFLLNLEDFPDKTDPHAIEDLKKANFRQLKDVAVISDYVFCSLLQSSRLASLDPTDLQRQISPPREAVAVEDEAVQSIVDEENALTGAQVYPKVFVEEVAFHSGNIITSQRIETGPTSLHKTMIKIYGLNKSSETVEKCSHDMNLDYFMPNKKFMSSIDYLRVPRLDWDDRHIQYEVDFFPTNELDLLAMNKDNKDLATIPKRIIVAGKYKDGLGIGAVAPSDDDHLMPFVALVDTQSWGRQGLTKFDNTMVKCLHSESKHSISKNKNADQVPFKITALNYGPYDNGHIILGFNTGFILILNSLDLAGMFRI